MRFQLFWCTHTYFGLDHDLLIDYLDSAVWRTFVFRTQFPFGTARAAGRFGSAYVCEREREALRRFKCRLTYLGTPCLKLLKLKIAVSDVVWRF